jgi:exodeoxyribonuclease VII small subunit
VILSKNFETKLEKLDTLVKNLEQQNLPLDKAIDTFKKGIELINECQSILKTAEQTIEKLSKNNSLEELDLKDDK